MPDLVIHSLVEFVVPEIFSEELLEQHDHELVVVKDYYNNNADMLEKVAHWKVLWDKFLEFEVSSPPGST